MRAWRVRGHEFHEGLHEFVMHQKREHNKIADAIANRCLDRERGHRIWLFDGIWALQKRVRMGLETHILGWFEGALRGGYRGAVGLHIQATHGLTTIKLYSESALFEAGAAYETELEAARRLIEALHTLSNKLSY